MATQPAATHTARWQRGENTAPDTERIKKMTRIMNEEKVTRRPKVDTRTVVGTILFLVVMFGAVLFIAVAGHI